MSLELILSSIVRLSGLALHGDVAYHCYPPHPAPPRTTAAHLLTFQLLRERSLCVCGGGMRWPGYEVASAATIFQPEGGEKVRNGDSDGGVRELNCVL